MRCLKPTGLFYLNAPSAGSFHRYPVDCWSFYPDSGKALVNWAKCNSIDACLLESFTHVGGSWQDFVAIFLREQKYAESYPARILDVKTDFENGQFFGKGDIMNHVSRPQNERTIDRIKGQLTENKVLKA